MLVVVDGNNLYLKYMTIIHLVCYFIYYHAYNTRTTKRYFTCHNFFYFIVFFLFYCILLILLYFFDFIIIVTLVCRQIGVPSIECERLS